MPDRDTTLWPKGYQQITSLAATASLTVPQGANMALLKPETQAVRYSDTGEDPLIGAPTACTATVGTAGNVNVGTHSYKVTFVNAQGETTGGTVSNQINITSSAKRVDLTNIPIGGRTVTDRKIYRTVAGDTGNYLLVASVGDNTTTAYTDNIADGSLGAAAPASNGAKRGEIIDVGDEVWYVGKLGLLRFVEVTASAVLNVCYYR